MLPCRHPVTAFPPVSGKGRWLAAPVGPARGSAPRERPCGGCIPCRLNRRAEWSLRMQLESACHDFAYFATLTYAPEHDPPGGSLVPRHLSEFLKRLRARLEYDFPGARLRFSGCGEYGTHTRRAHYHVLIFLGSTMLPDLLPWRRSESRELLFRSKLCEEAWGMGHVELGSVTEASCNYVAGYMLKKQHRGTSEQYLQRVDAETGETWQVAPEFSRHSTRPGIGATWFQRWPRDVIGSDGQACIVLRGGARRSVPGYFLRLLKRSSARVAAGLPAVEGLEGLEGVEDVIAAVRDQRGRDAVALDLRAVGDSRELLAAMQAADRERVAEYRAHMLSLAKETL